jgi:hypothetical protein
MPSEEQIKLMRKLACMLHGAFFGTLYELRKEKGLFGVWEYATKGISHILAGYLTPLGNAEIEDILSDLEKTGVYQGLELKREENKFTFKIGKCSFAGGKEGVHKQLGPLDIPCPFALFVGGYIARRHPSKRLYAYPSIYTEEGTITEMELLTPQEYEQKTRKLAEIAKIEKESMERLHEIRA